MLLPFVTGTTVPLGSILIDTTKEPVQTVLIQKQNIEADGVLAFNQVIDPKALAELKAQKAKADAIDSYFKAHDMPLSGTGMKMVEEAEKNNIDWRLLPAIAIRESTGGKHDCIKADNNPFGWGSCKISFNSTEEAIETVAKNLGGNNPKTESHYDNKTTKQILHAYNPPSVVPRYANQVMSIMDAIGDENLGTETNA